MAATKTVEQVVRAQIRKVREDRGWSYKTFAANLKEWDLKLSASALNRIETGDQKISAWDLVTFAACLGVAPMALMTDSAVETFMSIGGVVEATPGHYGPWFDGTLGQPIEAALNLELGGTAADVDFYRAHIPQPIRSIEHDRRFRPVEILRSDMISFLMAERGIPGPWSIRPEGRLFRNVQASLEQVTSEVTLMASDDEGDSDGVDQ